MDVKEMSSRFLSSGASLHFTPSPRRFDYYSSVKKNGSLRAIVMVHHRITARPSK